MSHLPPSIRTLSSYLTAPFAPATRRVLSALSRVGDVKVPTPEAAFHCESVLLTVVGVLQVLAPLFVLRSSFLGAAETQEEVEACVDEKGEEAIGAMLVALIQAVGGLYLLTASMLCTAAEVATKEMLVSLSAGHLLNAVLYLSIVLNFVLPAGSFGFTVVSLLLHGQLSALLYYIARKQPDAPPRIRLPAADSTELRRQQPQPQQQQQASDARRRAVQPSTAQSAMPAAAGKEEMDGSGDEYGEDEEEDKRGALTKKAFAATLSKRM